MVASKLDDKGSDAGTGGMDSSTGNDADVDATMVNCLGMENGTFCGQGSICRNGLCVASTCGDGIVSAENGEDCEDGNDVYDDGCYECIYNCRNSGECDDSDVCNGVEECSAAHTCQYSTPAEDGTACLLTDETDGMCTNGVCAPAGCGDGSAEGVEECDDMNDVDGDGCDRDCTFSCHNDDECQDETVCDGREKCELGRHICQDDDGSAIFCDDGNDCTSNHCDPLTGECKYSIPDGDMDGYPSVTCTAIAYDCDDSNPLVYPGAPEGCEDGIDNDCNPTTGDAAPLECYPDLDDDFYPNTGGMSVTGCTCPPHMTPSRADHQIDCVDGTWPRANDVHPDQPAFFETAHCRAPPTEGECRAFSFDYDCSGTDELRDTYAGLTTSCTPTGGTGVTLCQNGWATNAPPGCGMAAPWRRCSFETGSGCVDYGTMTRVQACH